MKPHTPGPWEVRVNDSGYLVQIHRAEPIGAGPMIARVYSDEALEDARLIAAAPELLEALRGVVATLDGLRILERSRVVESARAAIAKAEGRP